MNKMLNFIALSLSAVFIMSSCAGNGLISDETSVTTETSASPDGEGVFPIEITDYSADGIANTCVLEKKPERVAVLFSSFADIWTIAGGDIAVTVGESVTRGFADGATPLVDSSAGKTIDCELLLSYEPDFVICSADIEAQADADALLDSLGIPSVALHVESFEDYLTALKLFTDITGDAQAYQTYGVDVGNEIDTLLENFSGADEKEILFIRAGSKASATKAKNADDNFVCRMLSQLGVHNIADDAPVLLDGLSLEEIISRDPDFIFISTMGDENAAKEYMNGVLAGDGYNQLNAVVNANYAYLPKELFQYKPNARWAEAYRYLIDLLS
ncbi:MAG: ABC transporter substrate-binding protein [Eubacteriales bacterium]